MKIFSIYSVVFLLIAICSGARAAVYSCQLSSCTYGDCRLVVDTNLPQENYGMAFWAQEESSLSIHCNVDTPGFIDCDFISWVDSSREVISSFRERVGTVEFSHGFSAPQQSNQKYQVVCRKQ